jgi:AcrR family transcriptional regulator
VKKEPNQRRDEIIEKAASLFQEQGYRAVSMRKLALHLDIKASSLYNHINSKQEILSEIVMELARDFTIHIQSVSRSLNKNAGEKMREIIEMHVRVTIRKTDFLACLNNDWMHLGEKDREEYIEMRQSYESDFRAILEEGIQQNQFVKMDKEIAVFSMLSSLRTFYLWLKRNPEQDEQHLIDEMNRNLLDGILK